MIARGSIFWVDLGPPTGSQPAKRRPVLIVQSDAYNTSRIGTAVAAVVTSNTALATMPGNVFLPSHVTGLPKDSVVNTTAVVTLSKEDLRHHVSTLSPSTMSEVDAGLRLVLGL